MSYDQSYKQIYKQIKKQRLLLNIPLKKFLLDFIWIICNSFDQLMHVFYLNVLKSYVSLRQIVINAF